MNTLGATYLAADQLFSNPSLELIELSPLGERGQIIFRGPEDEVQNFCKRLSVSDILQQAIIKDEDGYLLKSYLSLESANPERFVLIAESDFLGEIFKWARQFVDAGCVICDLRQLRGHNSPCFLILSGQNLEKTEALVRDLKNKKISFIKEPQSKLIQFLSVAP